MSDEEFMNYLYKNVLFSIVSSLVNDGFQISNNTLFNNAQDPFNFDADPDSDPGSALEKNGSGFRSFLKDLLNFLTKNNFKIFFANFYPKT